MSLRTMPENGQDWRDRFDRMEASITRNWDDHHRLDRKP